MNERAQPQRRLMKGEYAVQRQKASDSRNRNCISVAGLKGPKDQFLFLLAVKRGYVNYELERPGWYCDCCDSYPGP